MDTDSFTVYIRRDYFYKGILEGVETRFDASRYELNKPLPKGKNQKVSSVMEDVLGGIIMKNFFGLFNRWRQ